MKQYINPHGFAVFLTGPNGENIRLNSRQKKLLPEYYERYVLRGYIKPILSESVRPSIKTSPIRSVRPKIVKPTRQTKHVGTNRRQIVGKTVNEDAKKILEVNLQNQSYPISNGIGVGILSYNRASSLKRLVDSVLRFTDITRTKVFISDDASDDISTQQYLLELEQNRDIVVIRNSKRLGVAGNSNRLLRCLSRFKFGILLNDDVQILNMGWDRFYTEQCLQPNGLSHVVYQQPGVYGSTFGKPYGNNLRQITDKPHGAVLAFTARMLEKCGYFDEGFGLYGMEHVDWSMRPFEAGLQPEGFFDVVGSDRFFKIYPDKTSIEHKSELLATARQRFKSRTFQQSKPSDDSAVDSVSYVVPFRNLDRGGAIETVLDGIRAQSFPNIQIIAVEDDSNTKISLDSIYPVEYLRVDANPLFNKSRAFNRGVSKAVHDVIVLHDADMLAPCDYTRSIFDILKFKDGCHLGKTVIYADKPSTDRITQSRQVNLDSDFDRVVGYYEGGSLACKKATYWSVGGFDERYEGYGCEDCDFYERISSISEWFGTRTVDMLHLYHGRVSGWNTHHEENKKYHSKLMQLSMPARIQAQINHIKSLGYI